MATRKQRPRGKHMCWAKRREVSAQGLYIRSLGELMAIGELCLACLRVWIRGNEFMDKRQLRLPMLAQEEGETMPPRGA